MSYKLYIQECVVCALICE